MGRVTVVRGVVTVAVVPVGVVTVAAVIGVVTATVAAMVVGNVGIVTLGKGTVGARSVKVLPGEPGVDAGAELTFETPAVLK